MALLALSFVLVLVVVLERSARGVTRTESLAQSYAEVRKGMDLKLVRCATAHPVLQMFVGGQGIPSHIWCNALIKCIS